MEINYKPNSHKAKADETEKKKVEKVVKGSVQTKKRSRLKDIFISEDAGNVKSYVFMDVLVPAIKKAISDIVTDGIDMVLYGGDRSHKRGRTNATTISYRDYYDSGRNRAAQENRTLTGYSYDDIIFNTKYDADEVLARMDELVATYGMVKVADMYDLVGITGNYTDNKYGWTSVRNAEVVRVRDGWTIKLPRALAIN